MTGRIHSAIFVVFLCIIPGFLLPGEAAPEDLLARLRERQEKVHDLQADFIQERTSELLRRPVKSAGKFIFRKPDLIRWEYTGDTDMIVVHDGKSLWIYYPGFAEAEQFSDVARYSSMLNFRMDSFRRDFDIRGEDRGDYLLVTLTPKRKGPFSLILMEFLRESAFPRKTVLTDHSGNSTTITFSNVAMNTSLPDRLFRFSPPPGTKIRERSVK